MSDMPNQSMPAPAVLTPWSVEGIAGLRGYGTTPSLTAGLSSQTWPVANTALIYGFSLHSHEIARKLLRLNGTTPSGNVDIGIYDGECRLIVSTGLTAVSGASAIQVFDIDDTHLGPGRYWLAATATSTAASIYGATISDENLGSAMVYEAALGTGNPLPSTIVPVLATGTAPMWIAIAIQFAPYP